MINSFVLLIIAGQGYHPVEYGYTRRALEEAGITVVIASDRHTFASARPSINHSAVCSDPACNTMANEYPQYATAPVDATLNEISPEKYDGIFIIGGPGALEFLNNQKMYSLMQKAAHLGKLHGAICVSPRILAQAGILGGKRVTGWDGDSQLSGILREHGAIYVKEPVVIDDNLITANGPDSAVYFGKAIVHHLKNKAAARG